MTLKERVRDYYYEQNYNCAESVLRGANDHYDLGLGEDALKLVGGFGGGLQVGSTCGAYLAASCVLSLLYMKDKAHNSPAVKRTMQELDRAFTADFESKDCSVLRPIYLKPGKRCLELIERVCDMLEEIVDVTPRPYLSFEANSPIEGVYAAPVYAAPFPSEVERRLNIDEITLVYGAPFPSQLIGEMDMNEGLSSSESDGLMKKCPECGTKMAVFKKFCPECGRRVE